MIGREFFERCIHNGRLSESFGRFVKNIVLELLKAEKFEVNQIYLKLLYGICHSVVRLERSVNQKILFMTVWDTSFALIF